MASLLRQMPYTPQNFPDTIQAALHLVYPETATQTCYVERGVLKRGSKFTGEQQCRSVISIKLQSNFIEITLKHGCSPLNFRGATTGGGAEFCSCNEVGYFQLKCIL